MKWYNDMPREQQNQLKKVVAVSIIGVIVILFISVCFQSILYWLQ